MSDERMQAREIELKAPIDDLLKRAENSDKTEADEPELDISADLARRQERLAAIVAVKQGLEARRHEEDTQRGHKPGSGSSEKGAKDDEGGEGDQAALGSDDASSSSSASDPGLQTKNRGRAFKRAVGVPEPKARANFTDPDSRISNTISGFEQCFNAPTAVDVTAPIIAAARLTNGAADSAQLPGMGL